MSDRLVWIDLETTGLPDDENLEILEVACVITDEDLNEVADTPFESIVCHDPARLVMNDFVRAMHTRSGLLSAVETGYLVSNDRLSHKVAAALCEYIETHTDGDGKSPLCGSSVHFDRTVLATTHSWSRVLDLLHYRNIDVTTLYELAKRWAPSSPVHKRVEVIKGAGGHRALADIRVSIAMAREYRAFFEGLGVPGNPFCPERGN